MTATKNIGISLKASLVLFVVSLGVIFFWRTQLHPILLRFSAAIYFISVVGLILHLLVRKLKITKDNILIPLCLSISFAFSILTYFGFSAMVKADEAKIKADSEQTIAIVKNISTSTSRRGHKSTFVDIEYFVRTESFTATFGIASKEVVYYAVGDTLEILYLASDPNNFKVIGNSNKNAREAKEDLIKLFNGNVTQN